MTCMKSVQLAIFNYLHVARDHTTLCLVQLQGTQHSGDGELGEFEEEHNIPVHLLWYSTHLSLFFSFMPAQPQQADRYIMIDHIVLSLMPVDGQTVHVGQSQNSLFL